MKKYQGEDIYFTLNFTMGVDNDITSFDSLHNIVVYAYTNDKNIVKFSKLDMDGYEPLIDVSGDWTVIRGALKSEHTANMSGQVSIDVMCSVDSGDSDGIENMIQRASSGIFILPSIIKQETIA